MHRTWGNELQKNISGIPLQQQRALHRKKDNVGLYRLQLLSEHRICDKMMHQAGEAHYN
jgi:3-polyprenyl-4-hydroxybenzoate decarboxylase